MKYIDAGKLLAEIKIIQQSLESRDVRLNQVKKIRTDCLIEFCKCITDVIDSLQQEQSEVDLESEIKKIQKEYKTIDEYDGYPATIYASNIEWIAKHFFELGFNAKQG